MSLKSLMSTPRAHKDTIITYISLLFNSWHSLKLAGVLGKTSLYDIYSASHANIVI